MASLTSEQQSAVQQLRSQVRLEDEDTLLAVLAAHGYDVQMAMSYILQQGIATARTPSASNSHSLNAHDTLLSEPLMGGPTPRSTATPRTRASTSAEYDNSWGSYLTVPIEWAKWLASFVVPASWLGTPTSSSSSTGPAAEPVFLQSMREQYPDLPRFYTGSYPAAVRYARSQQRPLAVYLHSAGSPATSDFLHNTLSSDVVRDFLNQQYVLWVGSIQHRDAYRLCHTLQATEFPFIALLGTEASSANQVSLLYRHSGQIEPEQLVAGMVQSAERHTSSTQQRRSALETSRSIIQTQNTEYEEALEADRQAKIKRAEEAERQKQAEEQARQEAERLERERKEAEESEAAAERRRQAERAQKFAALPVEPTTSNAVTMVIKVGNKRYTRKFLPTEELNTVYNYVDTIESEDALKYTSVPYQLVSNFPRKVFERSATSLQQLQMGRQIMLIVEPIDEEDDEQ